MEDTGWDTKGPFGSPVSAQLPLGSPAKNAKNEGGHPVFRAYTFIFGRGAEPIPGTRTGPKVARTKPERREMQKVDTGELQGFLSMSSMDDMKVANWQ
jgi:hypothetical protein